MKFIAIKTEDGTIKGKLAFYCRILHVSRQGFYKYLSVKDRTWKYQPLADAMLEIHDEDTCNDTYTNLRNQKQNRQGMYQDEKPGEEKRNPAKTGTKAEASPTDVSSSGESVFFLMTRSGCEDLKSASSINGMWRTMPNPLVRMANLSA